MNSRDRFFGRTELEWEQLEAAGWDLLSECSHLLTTYTELNNDLADATGQPPWKFSNPVDRNAMAHLLGADFLAAHERMVATLRVQTKRLKALEAWLGPGIWQPEGAEPRRPWDRFRLPSRIYLEIPGCCGNGGVAAVIEDHQPSGADQLAQVEQIGKYVVKDMAAIHERR